MAGNSIPLHCNICPKKPNFSDVSHLLTHVASKGHLSNYYKMKVRSTHEDAARRLIESYDCWYAQWNVEQLMSDRMSQKDKRRTRAKPAARAPASSKIEVPILRHGRSRVTGIGLLDPRLSEHQSIKIENSVTPTPPSMSGPFLRRRIDPHMQYWPTESRASSHSYTNPDYDTSSDYSEPAERIRPRYTVEDYCAVEDDPADAVPVNRAVVSECTKLKGIYWPGMDLFDSATPEMRRKRNQKKDISVIEQLELNSQEVEPTEVIFTPHGSFKKQRRISSSVYDDEESSPIKAESPHQPLTRPPLADVDSNSRRSRQFGRPSPFPFLTRNQYDNERPRLGHEPGYGEPALRRKRGFEVYQDQEVSFAQPAGFNYLTTGFNPQPSPSPVPSFTLYKPLNDLFQYDNKENSLPGFHPSVYGNHHAHHPAGYQFHTYPYGLPQEQHTIAYHGHLYNGLGPYQQEGHNHDDDDERTITAPPSPATS